MPARARRHPPGKLSMTRSKPVAPAIAACVAFLASSCVRAEPVRQLHGVQVTACVQAPGAREGCAPPGARDSTEPVRASLRESDIGLVGPQGGGMQALALLPNVRLTGYATTGGSSDSGLYLRGLKLGYNEIPGDLATNILTAEFDGVPLNDLIRNTSWHSSQAPMAALLQRVDVTAGPGDAATRWYDSLGGSIDFIPPQPGTQPGTKVELSGGSFRSGVASLTHVTGQADGWSSALGVAGSRSESFRDGPDRLPAHALQAYFKTRRLIEGGRLDLGLYGVRQQDDTPPPIPVSLADAQANGIDLQGLGAGPGVYSQPSAGYQASLPNSLWRNRTSLQNTLYWARLHLRLAPELAMTELAWLQQSHVQHVQQNDFSAAAGVGLNAASYARTLGDKLDFTLDLGPAQQLRWGGYVLFERSQGSSVGYTPRPGISLQGDGIVAADVQDLSQQSTRTRFWALYLQDRARIGPGLTVVPGLRAVGFQTQFHNASAGLASALGVDRALADPSPDTVDHHARLEPSLGVTLAVAPGLRVHASYAVAFHNPDLENYDTGMSVAPRLSTLALLRARSVDAGLVYTARPWRGLHDMRTALDVFETHLGGQTIGYSSASNPNQITFGSGASTLRGVELRARASLGQHWRGFVNAGWLRSRWDAYVNYDTGASFAGRPVSNLPQYTASAGATYRHFLREGIVDTTLWVQSLGPYPMFDNQQVGPSTRSVGGHTLLNLDLRYSSAALAKLIPGAQLASLQLHVINLTDRQYDSAEYIAAGDLLHTPGAGYVLAYPGTPRAIYLSISANY